MHKFQPRPLTSRTSSKAVTSRISKNGRSILGAGIVVVLLLQFLGAKLLFGSNTDTLMDDQEIPPVQTNLGVTEPTPEPLFVDGVLQSIPPSSDEKETNKLPDWAVDLVLSTPQGRSKEEQYDKLNALMVNGLIPESLHAQLVAKVARGDQISIGNVEAAVQLNSRSQISRESGPSDAISNPRGKLPAKDTIPVSDIAPPEIPVSDIAPKKRGDKDDGGRIIRLGDDQLGCGDGERSEREGCDDGNSREWDGCSSLCTVEDGWICARGSQGPSGGPSTCHQERPESTLRVLFLPANAPPAPWPLVSDVDIDTVSNTTLCLRDCASCRGPTGEACRQYCAHGLVRAARAENAPPSCLFKRRDAVFRCLSHPECRSVTCVDQEQQRPFDSLLDEDEVSMSEADRHNRMRCVAFSSGVSDAGSDPQATAWPAELKHCQKVEGACATLVIAEEKRLSAPTSFAASAMPFLCCCPVPHDLATPSTAELQHSNINRRVAHLLRRLSPDRIKNLETRLLGKQHELASLLTNRTQLQATVSALGYSLKRDDQDRKEKAVRELFRLQTLHQTLTVDIPSLQRQLLLRVPLDTPVRWVSAEEWAQNHRR